MNRYAFSLFGALCILVSTNMAWAIPTPASAIDLNFIGEEASDVATDYAASLNPPLVAQAPSLITKDMHDSPQSSYTTWTVELDSAPGVTPATHETITLDCSTDWYKHGRFGYASENDCDVVSPDAN